MLTLREKMLQDLSFKMGYFMHLDELSITVDEYSRIGSEVINVAVLLSYLGEYMDASMVLEYAGRMNTIIMLLNDIADKNDYPRFTYDTMRNLTLGEIINQSIQACERSATPVTSADTTLSQSEIKVNTSNPEQNHAVASKKVDYSTETKEQIETTNNTVKITENKEDIPVEPAKESTEELTSSDDTSNAKGVLVTEVNTTESVNNSTEIESTESELEEYAEEDAVEYVEDDEEDEDDEDEIFHDNYTTDGDANTEQSAIEPTETADNMTDNTETQSDETIVFEDDLDNDFDLDDAFDMLEDISSTFESPEQSNQDGNSTNEVSVDLDNVDDMDMTGAYTDSTNKNFINIDENGNDVEEGEFKAFGDMGYDINFSTSDNINIDENGNDVE